ncbi:MAG: alpha/beta hydrolase-fold protein [Armatimonadota bacterium]
MVCLTALLATFVQAQIKGFEQAGTQWTFSEGETKLSGVLYKPEGDGPFPVLLISHGKGGSAAAMASNFAPDLTKKGIVCIAVDYTHARNGTGTAEGASAENIRRAKKTLEIARSLKYVDPSRVAAFGHSMGGFVTVGLVADPEAKIMAAIVSAGGIASASGFPAPDPATAKRIKVPTLMLHGDHDTVVPPERSASLKEILDEIKTPNERVIYKGENHNIIRSQREDMVVRIVSWLEKYGVMKQQPSQWVTLQVTAPRVQQYILQSQAVKAQVSYHLYLPKAYEEEKTRRFPVLYWLHGSGGGLTGVRPVSGFFDAAIQAGNIPPMIIVFPNSFANGMWCDSADGKRPIETIVVKEMIPKVDSKFRTITKREGRIVEGFSMGGYGAGRFGFKYPHLFAGISMLAAGPLDLEFNGPRAESNPDERERILQSVYGGKIEEFKAQSPWTLAESNASKLKSGITIRICIGEDDFTLPANRKFSTHLTQLGVPHTFLIRPKVSHDTLDLLKAIGDENWKFYRSLFTK